MNDKILDKMLEISERFFGTMNDSDQIPITKESFYKLQKLHLKTVISRLDNGEPISWIIILPTQIELMEKFLKGKINERELLNMTEPQQKYEALYLCAAFTMPEHRRKGYVLQMFREAIDAIPHAENVKLFAWAFSDEGRKIIEKLNSILRVNILVKN
ncbi:hypothetical protein GW950_02030 [Candidatus Wolfebacteria bacterium]|nr:hypothetical protein [Candidatus Wolfebacteria bacterium]